MKLSDNGALWLCQSCAAGLGLAGAMPMKIFYAMLVERTVDGDVTQQAFDIGAVSALTGCARIPQGQTSTDKARNHIVTNFLKSATSEADVLVMLDNDHTMPVDIVPKLADKVDAAHQVVGALAFRRSKPHDPCYFVRAADGKGLDVPMSFKKELEPCLMVGTGAIAIRRSVFTALEAAGLPPPWFRYEYVDNQIPQPTEDYYFGQQCEKIGVSHWVDTSWYIPHLTKRAIGYQDWIDFMQEADSEPDRINSEFANIGFRVVPTAANNGTERIINAAGNDGSTTPQAPAVAVPPVNRTGRRADFRGRGYNR